MLPDPSGGLVVASQIVGALDEGDIRGAAVAAKPFVERILGPASDQLGTYLGEVVGTYLLTNRLKVIAKASKILEDHGLEATADGIPMRTSVAAKHVGRVDCQRG